MSQANSTLTQHPVRKAPQTEPSERVRIGWLASWLASRGYGVLVAAVLCGMILVPVGFLIFGAMRSGAPFTPGTTFSGESLSAVFGSGEYLISFGKTVLFSLAVGVTAVIMSAVLAWLLARTNVPNKRALEALVVLPLFLSPFLLGVAWFLMAAPNSGIINVTLQSAFGIDGPVLNVTTTPAIVVIVAMGFVPYGYLIIAPALRNMDPSLEEAAHINGAGQLRTMARITMPAMRPSLLAALLLITVITTGVFAVPAVLSERNSFLPLAVQIFRSTTDYPANYPYAAAMGCSLLVLVGVILYLYRRSIRASKRFATVGGRGFRPRVVDLGKFRYVGAGICYFYLLVSIVLPYLTLMLVALSPYATTDLSDLHLTLENFRQILGSTDVREALYTTMKLGVIAPTACLILAMSISYIVERTSVRGRQILQYVAIGTVAIPGLVFGIGMLWAYVHTPMYATMWILAIAFVALYLPHATLMTSSGLIQIDPVLEESAAMCGAGRIKRVVKITLPLIKSTVVAVWILTFILSVRELNVAAVLYSPGSNVLSVLTWNYTINGNTRLAAAVGIIQTAVMMFAVLIGLLVFRLRLTRIAR